jgi:hypothetical protein
VATTRDRVMAETMPPKSALPLTARERQTLLAWLDQGANDAPAGTTCAALPAPPPHEEETLDCTPSHTFVSGGAEGYAVPLEQNHY